VCGAQRLKAVPKPSRPLPTQIILSVAEHHANLVPWQMLAKRTGAVLRHAELTPTQEVDVEVGFASPPPTPAVSSAASAKEAAWQCLMTYLYGCRMCLCFSAFVSDQQRYLHRPAAELPLCLLRARFKHTPRTDGPLLPPQSEVTKARRQTRTPLLLPMQAVKAMIGPKTKLVSLVHVSNMLGAILPTDDIVAAAQKASRFSLQTQL